MNPYLSNNDIIMFYKYLDKAKIYFEYGSGGSTYQASIRDNIIKIYCVESDNDWLNKLKENIKKNNITYLFK
jgi:signal transduction histidine kinase